jgi:hypothetical protein
MQNRTVPIVYRPIAALCLLCPITASKCWFKPILLFSILNVLFISSIFQPILDNTYNALPFIINNKSFEKKETKAIEKEQL